jgi:hypothetical protein
MRALDFLTLYLPKGEEIQTRFSKLLLHEEELVPGRKVGDLADQRITELFV